MHANETGVTCTVYVNDCHTCKNYIGLPSSVDDAPDPEPMAPAGVVAAAPTVLAHVLVGVVVVAAVNDHGKLA